MKTVFHALKDEIHFPIPEGFVENVCIKRELEPSGEFNAVIANENAYKGALADCPKKVHSKKSEQIIWGNR